MGSRRSSGRALGDRTARGLKTAPGLTAALLAAAALTPSCSDLPTQPRATVVVSGTVRDPGGSPVAGATMGFFTIEEELRSSIDQPIATANGSGVYSISLPAGRYQVSAGGSVDAGIMPVRLPDVILEAPRVTLDYRFTGFRLTGRLIGPGGNPLSSGSATAHGRSIARSPIAGGRFSFLLPADTYRLSASPGPSNPGLPSVSYAGIQIASDTTIDLSVDGHAVSGTVRGPGGAPLRDASLSAYGAIASVSTQSENDGSYHLYVPSGEYLFSVLPGNTDRFIASRSYPAVLITSPRVLDFDLSGVEWTGTVRLTPSGDPVASVSVAVAEEGPPPWGFARTLTDPQGQFRLVVKPYGFYTIDLSSEFGAIARRRIESVQAVSDSTFDLYVEQPTP